MHVYTIDSIERQDTKCKAEISSKPPSANEQICKQHNLNEYISEQKTGITTIIVQNA